MSKLSFRARALDSNKSLPVYHAKDIPDLAEFSSVNRVVPQMPTGMEKEEETEHHLQRAITAQQIYGEANRRIIPTPEAMYVEATDGNRMKKTDYAVPKQLIHVQAFTLEDELPDYDLDSEDEAFLETMNKNRTKALTSLELERMIDKLEKGCGSYSELSFSEAKLLIRIEDQDLVEKVFGHWSKAKKKSEHPTLTPFVKTEKKDGSTTHDPYVAFRRRIEKMQTRKNRKNDEASYERMLKLRRDLNRACKILELVKQREEMKKDMLKSVVGIFEQRYKKEDFSGELLKQFYHLLRDRQAYAERQAAERRHMEDRLQAGHAEEHLRSAEANEELRKRARAQKRLPGQLGEIPMEGDGIPSPSFPTEPDDDPPGPDGEFTFKRKRGVLYRAPRYDSAGNWPWVHPVEGGSGDVRFRYCCTSIRKPRKCIGFARRRTGRGGRILFDRAWTPFDDCSTVNAKKDTTQQPLPNGVIPQMQEMRVPPWPHFKPLSEFLDDDDTSPNTPVRKLINSRFRRDSSDAQSMQPRPRLYRSFSTQPTSKFRVNPYPTNGVCVNNQTFLSSLTSSLSKGPETQTYFRKLNQTQSNNDGLNSTWTNAQTDLSSSLNHSQSVQRNQSMTANPSFPNQQKLSNGPQSYIPAHGATNTVSSYHGQNASRAVHASVIGNQSNPVLTLTHAHASSPTNNRLPPTGPSTAVFQLNFPMLKNKTPATTPSKAHLNRRLSSSGGENSRDHRHSVKRNNQTPTKNSIPNVPTTHFRQAISTAAGSSPALNVARTQETLPAFNTFRRTSTDLPSATPAAEVK